ncbi:MAG: crossover junction endodeoxyribonuclease RuvC [Phycisphaerales bacterium]|nr:crossover junction endodeoxyribonuclease RuvC [Phycisphaerales bacterium]
MDANLENGRSRCIVGIDPGLQRTGYAIIHGGRSDLDVRLIEAGVVRITPKVALEHRLIELESNLEAVFSAHNPRILACEQLFAHYKHPRTAILMGHARGVVLALAARRNISVVHIASTHAKRWLTGNGHASKAQVQRAVAATLRLPCLPEPHDVADAIAIALSGLRAMAERVAVETTRRIDGLGRSALRGGAVGGLTMGGRDTLGGRA